MVFQKFGSKLLSFAIPREKVFSGTTGTLTEPLICRKGLKFLKGVKYTEIQECISYTTLKLTTEYRIVFVRIERALSFYCGKNMPHLEGLCKSVVGWKGTAVVHAAVAPLFFHSMRRPPRQKGSKNALTKCQ